MIDVNSLTEQAVETVFSLIPQAVIVGTYIRKVTGQGSADYDPETDTVAAPLGSIPDVRMIKSSATQEELVGTNVTVDDVKFLIPAKDLPSVTPSIVDNIIAAGTTYDIIKIKPLPVKTIHILFCRAK